jgi:hypothetical protein
MKDTEHTQKNPWSYALIGFIVGAGVVGLWSLQSKIPGLTLGENTDDKHEEEPTSTSALLSISDQPAGETVTVSSVSVPAPGVWVAIQEEGNDGALLGVLGAARVRFQSTDVVVSLLRATEAGKKYVAVLYRDDGDDLFLLDKDSVYVDFESGERVLSSFATTP